MITRLVFLAAIVSVLISGVSAQEYSIRIHNNSNLRDGASLSAAIVETAPAGTVLQVGGSFGRWLHISRGGRGVWMAGWIGYTRVEAPQSRSVDIDNCCFVNRQCANDQEWADGYWAFQRNECPVSASSGQAPTVTGSAPASDSARSLPWTPNMTEGVKHLLANPAHDPFNNCCFMYWETCQSDEEWGRGYHQFQEHQCIHPQPLGSFPEIVGNNLFRRLVNDAVGLMRIHTPEWIEYIKLSGVRKLEQLNNDVGGGFFNTQWMVGHSFYSWQVNDPNWAPDPDYVVGYAGGIT
ncbi:MAG: SH3 domain-containing protein, partial [Chloroflexi bacterium]|nr:SH3 domain-containing protein [Chloroflexota bacterium]